MTTLQEAARKAIDAFGGIDWHDEPVDHSWAIKAHEAIESLREALAQQGEQQPFAWYCMESGEVFDIEYNSQKSNYNGDWKPLYTAAPAPQAQEPMTDAQLQQWIDSAPQPAQGGLEKLRAPLIQWHQNMAEVCRDSDGTAYLNHRDTAALLQSAQPVAPHECKTEAEKLAYAAGWWKALEVNRVQPVAQPLTIDDFEEWHKSNFAQTLDRHGYTYSDASVRNRWIGWQAAHGIREVK